MNFEECTRFCSEKETEEKFGSEEKCFEARHESSHSGPPAVLPLLAE